MRKIQRRALQRKEARAALDETATHDAAAKGTSGAGAPLPHLEAIQRSFGRHDVGGVAAHTDDSAAAASRAMGAEAFATNGHVAFDGAPTLHTAAHEAAHVIQQRSGVQLKGGIGEAGDPFEQQADQVADRVVAGRSAEPILDGVAGAGTAEAQRPSGGVQRKIRIASPAEDFHEETHVSSEWGLSSAESAIYLAWLRSDEQHEFADHQELKAAVKEAALPRSVWATWAQSQVGKGHVITTAGDLLRINGLLDVDPAMLEQMKGSDLEGLKTLFLATMRQREGKPTKEDTRHLDKLATSSGGRLRFLEHVGSSHEGPDTSTVDAFIEQTLKPLYRGHLPAFLLRENLTPMNRQRLYDLPNAKRKEGLQQRGLQWAIEQNASTVSELVNFTEYFLGHIESLDGRAAKRSQEEFNLHKGSIEVSEEERSEKAKELRAAATLKRLRSTYGPLIGAVVKGSVEESHKELFHALTRESFGAPDLGDEGVKAKLKEKITEAISSKALEADDDVPLTKEELLAGAKSVRGKKEDELRARIKIEVRREMEEGLGDHARERFSAERHEASELGHAGGGTPIDKFWSKGHDEQVEAIRSVAGEGPLPFFGSDSAAYHSLKHYGDIGSTEDRAGEGKSELAAYLTSSRRTVAAPDEKVERQASQFVSRPAFMFYRTIKPAPGLQKAVRMRAIVIVADDGAPKVATYFRA